ncbi:MAG: NHL repeat-containing protein, partial [Planctomycetota bacterium]
TFDNDPTGGDPDLTLLAVDGVPGGTLEGLETSLVGAPHDFTWDADLDLASILSTATPVAQVDVVATPRGGPLEGAARRVRFFVGEEAPSIVLDRTSLEGASPHGALVPISFDLVTTASDPAAVEFTLTTPADPTPRPMAIVVGETEGLASSPGGSRHTVTWNALSDLGSPVTTSVTIQLAPSVTPIQDRLVGDTVASTFDVSTDNRVTAIIARPRASSVVNGKDGALVPLSFILVDGQASLVDVTIEVDAGDGRGLHTAPGGELADLPTARAGERHTFLYRPKEDGLDASSGDLPDVLIRIRPTKAEVDGVAGETRFGLNLNEEPLVVIRGPIHEGRALDKIEGEAVFEVELVDPEGDSCEILIQASRDGGLTFDPTPVLVSSLTPNNSGPPLLFGYDTIANALGLAGPEQVVLRMTPQDQLGFAAAERARLGAGPSVVSVFEVDNLTRPLPLIDPVPVSGVLSGAVAIDFTLHEPFDYLSDVSVSFSVDQGGSFAPATDAVGGAGSLDRLERTDLGESYRFTWDAGADLAQQVVEDAILRFAATNRPPNLVTPRVGTGDAVLDVDQGVTADLIVGGSGSASAFTFDEPSGLATDGVRLYVADTRHARVLVYRTLPSVPNEAADFALGQTSLDANAPGSATAAELKGPRGVATDGVRLFVTDAASGRLLIWTSPPQRSGEPADVVLPGIVGAGVAWDPATRTLAVAEPDQDRVLLWHGFDADAPAAPDTEIAAPSNAGALDRPSGVALADGKLLIADSGNGRVLIFDRVPAAGQGTTPADRVVGRKDLSPAPGLEPDRATLVGPAGLALAGGRLLVLDHVGNRLLT